MPATAVSNPRPKTLILDIYGLYARPLGSWVAVSDLVTLLGQLDVDEQAVRSAVSRMSRRGLLVNERRGGVSGYRISDEGAEMMEEADRRIFSTMEPAEVADGWVLVSFSMPETERDKRHTLRSQLTWMGFGNLSSGLWIAPRRALPELVAAIRRLGFEDYVDVFDGHYRGFDELVNVVARSWDLEGLRALYQDFVDEWGPAARAWARKDPDSDRLRAFADYTLALHQWRKLPYLDPGLPPELLPNDWAGRVAAKTFFTIRDRLVQAANLHVGSVVRPTLQLIGG